MTALIKGNTVSGEQKNMYQTLPFLHVIWNFLSTEGTAVTSPGTIPSGKEIPSPQVPAASLDLCTLLQSNTSGSTIFPSHM